LKSLNVHVGDHQAKVEALAEARSISVRSDLSGDRGEP